MLFELNDATVHTDLIDGKIRLSTGFTSIDQPFHEAAILHCSDENPEEIPELYANFSVSEILDCLVDMHGLTHTEGEFLDIKARPKIDALRAELSELIARIDDLKYEAAA